jgi:hypothetical protein
MMTVVVTREVEFKAVRNGCTNGLLDIARRR